MLSDSLDPDQDLQSGSKLFTWYGVRYIIRGDYVLVVKFSGGLCSEGGILSVSRFRFRDSSSLVFLSVFPQEWGGRGTLIFSYIRRLGLFSVVQHFEFQYFGFFFRKLNILGGMKILWIFIFWFVTKLDYI